MLGVVKARSSNPWVRWFYGGEVLGFRVLIYKSHCSYFRLCACIYVPLIRNDNVYLCPGRFCSNLPRIKQSLKHFCAINNPVFFGDAFFGLRKCTDPKWLTKICHFWETETEVNEKLNKQWQCFLSPHLFFPQSVKSACIKTLLQFVYSEELIPRVYCQRKGTGVGGLFGLTTQIK